MFDHFDHHSSASHGGGSCIGSDGFGLRRQTTETKANKWIYDHCKGPLWDTDATHVRLVDNFSMFGRLCDEIRTARKHGKELVTGKLFTDKILGLYRGHKDPIGALRILIDEKLPLTPMLVRAMTAVKRKTPDRTLMHAFVQSGPICNLIEWIGIVIWGLGFNFRNDQQRLIILNIFRYCAKHVLHKLFAEVFKIIFLWIQDVMLFLFSRSKSKVTPLTFINAHRKICDMVLPASDVSNVIAAKDNFLIVKTELQNIVDSGPLGEALFGSSITLFAHEAIDTFIDMHIARSFESGMHLRRRGAGYPCC